MSSVKKSMASQSNQEKKRIARIGTKSDKTISSCDDDIVTKIMKSMDSKHKLISYKKLEEWRERNQTVYSPNPEVSTSGVKQSKKLSLNKKHPLMEKCQKNLKYIKHNRCIPKQRAHVGEVFIPKNIKPNLVYKFNTTKVLNEEKNVQKKKAVIISKKQQKSNFLPYEKEEKSTLPSLQKSMDDEAVRMLNDSSESDCEFENFIRDQKEFESNNSESSSSSEIESASIKRKRKKQKLGKSDKAASCVPSELECSFSESSSDIERASVRCKRKKRKSDKASDVASRKLHASEYECRSHENSRSSEIQRASIKGKRKKQKSGKSENIASDVECNNCHEKLDESDFEMNDSLTFNDMSDSDSSETTLTPPIETDNDSKSNVSSSVNSNFQLDLTKADTDSYISKKFSCAVRILRNPFLDEKVVSSMKDPSKTNLALSSEGNQSKLSKNEDKINLESHSSQIKLSSDEDDCMIICEVPRSNDDSSVIEKSRESVLNENNLNYTSSLKTVSHVLSVEPVNESTQEIKNSPEIVIQKENNIGCASKSNNEFGIQILSVESLNTHLNNDYSANTTQNSKESEEITLNENFSPMTYISDEYVTDYSKNKTKFDTVLSNKDFFKQAKTYSEPQTFSCDSNALNNLENNSSLKDAYIIPKGSETNNYKCVPEINECLSKIDLNLINRTLKQTLYSENYINNCDNISGKITSPVSLTESLEQADLNWDNFKKSAVKDACVNDKPVLPPQILEIAQKIDFKKVLSLTNESSTDVKSNLVPDSLQQSAISTATSSNSFVLPTNKTNNFEKSALPHRLCAQSIESSNQELHKSISKLPKTVKTIIEKYIDSPSDELDVIAAASILDLDELKSNDIIPLLKVYLLEIKRYDKIKSAEQNVSEGLKILEETQLKRVKNLEQAVESVLQHDPCSYKIANTLKITKSDSSINIPQCRQEQTSLEHTISTKPEAKYCNNCGQLAKLKCLGCEKVYFCSEKCGLKFWEEGHASNCQKNPPHEKVENVI